ncbi:MAG: SEFIR domain-containing protein [Thiolinea sp.]
MTKVFISYSHDSPEHSQCVLDLSNRLREGGVDCDIDQYNPTPNEGWPLWMLRHMQDADHVILVCTETYQKRVEQREEKGKGAGVKWEGMLLLNQLYRNESLNTKFIPIVFDSADKAFIPDAIFGFSYFDLSEAHGYTRLYKHLWGELAVTKPELGAKQNIAFFYSDRLPTVKGEFFGRVEELQLLDAAWKKSPLSPLFQRGVPSRQGAEFADGSPPLQKGEQGGFSPSIIQFIAPGGTGKTKLLRHWLDHTDGIDALIAWSFYSQGAGEDKQTSATPFFTHAFEKLGSTRERFATEEDKGEHLAELLRRQRCVLVLDGLEPLQHAGSGMRGELKDRAIRQLLKSLAGHNNGLCIITTRIAVHELAGRAHVISHDLQNLALADGVRLLQSLGVKGSPTELNRAVREYGCHALALNLLGNVLRLRYQGDVRKRDTLNALVKPTGSQESRHAFKVMQAYEEWFTADPEHGPELALLHLLGLFDHPIGQEVLQVLWDAQIPHLTAGIDPDDWLEAIAGLREEHHLLSQHDGSTDLDCHPLIREYFGRQLQAQQPEAWRQAHETLYEYYKALPEKELPDTLEEMQPLFSAVAHGCAAGLGKQVMYDVFWSRIRRGNEGYLVKKLGGFSDDLAAMSHFFATPWKKLLEVFTDTEKAVLLNWVGFQLRALGRLREALEPMQANIEMNVKRENWKSAAVNASNLSELQLTLGEVAAARESGQRSVDYADQSGDWVERMRNRTTHADALHQAGEAETALTLFREAEQLQQEWQPGYPLMYSLQGFRYCDLLLAQGGTAEVLERADQTLKWAKQASGVSLLDTSLIYLTLGRAHLQLLLSPSPAQRERGPGGEGNAAHWLDQAVASLRAAGQQDDLPRGLLARAALHRHTRDFARARQSLQEVFDIAEPSGMRLHLTDYHLEMARVLLAEESPHPNPSPQA